MDLKSNIVEDMKAAYYRDSDFSAKSFVYAVRDISTWLSANGYEYGSLFDGPIVFRNEEDALAFKLRFGSIDG